MLDATRIAIEALRAYVNAEESSANLENQMANAIEGLLAAASRQDWDIGVAFDAYLAWLEEN